MSAAAAARPERVGPYELVLPLGPETHLARMPGADRYVALALTDAPLRSEVKLLFYLRHANVMAIYDAGDSGAGAFVVTEYVPGGSLATLQRVARENGRELPRRVAVRILCDALVGLHAAHEHADLDGNPLGLVHGRFSAETILVGTDGVARVTGLATTAAQITGEAPTVATDVRDARALARELLEGQALGDDARTALALAREVSSIARSAGLYAEASEIAEHVRRLTAAQLAARRSALAEAREQRRSTAPDVRTMIGMAGPAAPLRAQLPSLPDLPAAPLAVPEPPGSELAIQVNLAGAPADRASEGVLGAAPSAPEIEDGAPPVYESPVAPPRRDKKKIALVAGGGATAIAAIAVAVAASRGAPADAPIGSPPREAEGAPTSTVLIPTAPAVPPEEPEDPAPMLNVTADAPIAKVAVGARTIESEVPAPSVAVELTEEDDQATQRVVVTAVDGRVAIATAEPGTRDIEVTFGKTRPPNERGPR